VPKAPVETRRELDLAALGGRMIINEVEVGTGRGRDIRRPRSKRLSGSRMRWPRVADSAGRAWQAARLKAGEFVLLGSVGEIQWFEPGDQIQVEIGSLGCASRTFTR
jgi:2-keto-4-pentenoate hydratase